MLAIVQNVWLDTYLLTVTVRLTRTSDSWW